MLCCPLKSQKVNAMKSELGFKLYFLLNFKIQDSNYCASSLRFKCPSYLYTKAVLRETTAKPDNLPMEPVSFSQDKIHISSTSMLVNCLFFNNVDLMWYVTPLCCDAMFIEINKKMKRN